MSHYSMQPTFRYTIVEDLRAAHIPATHGQHVLVIAKHVLFGLRTRHDFACVFHIRMNARIGRISPVLGALMQLQRYYWFANDISYQAKIGPGFRIHHTSDIVIGRDVVIGSNVQIYNGVTLGGKSAANTHAAPVIGNGVLIGTGAKVLGRVKIGDGAVIGALTFCDKDVPEVTTAVGNPMRFLSKN